MVVLLPAFQCMAQEPDCTLNTTTTNNNAKYTLTVLPGPPGDPNPTFPYPVTGSDGNTWYQFDYTIDNIDIDNAYFFIPYDCEDPILIDTATMGGGAQYLLPGVGAGPFPEGNFNGQVLVIHPTVNRISYIANKESLGELSFKVAKGKFNYPFLQSIAGVGRQVEEVLTTRYEYDDLITVCVEKKLNPQMKVVQMRVGCFNPDNDETCPGSVTTWNPVTSRDIDYFYLGPQDLNVMTPGGIKVGQKTFLTDICPRGETVSFMDFLDFLAPPDAYAADCNPYTCDPSYWSGGNAWCLSPACW